MYAFLRLLAFAPLLAVLAPAPAHASSGYAPPAAAQPLLLLARTVAARAQPAPDARVVATVAARTPLTGARMVLPVRQTFTGPAGRLWLRVALPARPNEATGWVPADAGTARNTEWRIVIDRSERRAIIFDGTKVRGRFSVVVGKPSTPTPLGTFFVVEKLHLGPGVPEGPWALATSAYSDVLKQFGGGPGQIGLHGIVGLSAPLGTFSSHGCVRFANAAITWIASHVGAGTPVIVER
jgi:lipoprotein-anchoring transpeptidase ErfK/SrfK